ncbi:hypothetical protein FSARC_6043 [Fusarium sarcochroum]|uniref:Gfd2/YDR514C-like C-terminal domain-containing protein n=1 Tax=Fusarium sarcochroum TaxID=1208366 RepID=A0A8H4X9S4_9HYPO|nr:hypothetical protein FSARC_6043 [Fusarium sarcochroum]
MESTEITAVEPAHKGILRDDTSIIRWIFGYCDKARLSNASTWPNVPHTSPPTGANSYIRRLRFLSIDIDRLQEKDGIIQRFQIGVSFLDAQCLQNLLFKHHHMPPPDINLASHIIQSHHWVIEAKQPFKANSYMFLFGKAKAISILELEAQLQKYTQQPFILIVHEGKQELSVLKRLNINLNRYSLQQLLNEFKIPHRQLHTAGNDAHFTLRALLMISVRDAELQLVGKRLPDWVPVLMAIAQAPLPRVPPKKRERAAMAEAERQRRLEEKTTEEKKEEELMCDLPATHPDEIEPPPTHGQDCK